MVLPLKPSLKLAGIINSWTLPRYTMHLQACAILFGLRGTVDKATTGPPPQPYPPSSSRTEPRNPCKRCGPSGCSKGQLSLRQHPEPPCNASAQNSEIWNQMWHKRNKKQVLKQKLMTLRHSTWVGFQPACIVCQMDRYDGGIWLYSETYQKWRLKHSGSMYLCTNFSMSGAVRGFNSLGFSTSWVEYNEWIWCRHKRQNVLPSNPK